MNVPSLDLFPPTSGALFSADRTHRYSLWRRWIPETPLHRRCIFIGVNPSTADEHVNDPTVRRCIAFAKSWHCGSLFMLNLFAYRATDPKALLALDEQTAIGADNDTVIKMVTAQLAEPVPIVVAAWGVHGALHERGSRVAALLRKERVELCALGLTKDGHPRHPLYVSGSTDLMPL